ncbi:glucose-1-phosphate cytidylyltransferase [Candidatus Babeliales bacterium]|nr:glucose-1-phosphate cytidylyltransferase [Candidatus Babeliales bacterium]
MLVKKHNEPVIILAGGLGTRLREETEFRPKPMVPIGGKPILWHIMKIYAHFGFHRFIICLGYKGEMIKDYFLNYRLADIDFTINTKTGTISEHGKNSEEWEITLVDTGQDCFTGGRIARCAEHIKTDRFLVTYGDGVADINIEKLLAFHKSHKRIATLSGVNPPSRFGNLEIENQKVTSFLEKQTTQNGWINGGFFIFEKEFLRYLSTDSRCVLEQEPLQNAALDDQLMIYKHNGFWQCMDTIREHQKLEALWKNQNAPWKVWQDSQPKIQSAFVTSAKSTLTITF